MSQPVWKTPAGDLGTYNIGTPINLTLSAAATFPASYLEYKLLSGELPTGVSLDAFGNINGIPSNSLVEKNFTFTIRATDELNKIRDRTFNLATSSVLNKPKITTLPGEIINVIDSLYVDYKIQYSNVVSSNNISFTILAGNLPPGLYLNPEGIIKGYPKKPFLANKSPTTIKYTFTVLLTSDLGNDIAIFSIVVRNKQLSSPLNNRIPVILNKKPLHEPIRVDDPYTDYYLLEGESISTIKANEYFAFKIIAVDFDNSLIDYQFGGLPPGLVGNSTTGWITGIPKEPRKNIVTYDISVSVAKRNNQTLVSAQEIFRISIRKDIEEDIAWNTGSDLGTIFNGTISMLKVSATATESLVYEVVSGSLPKNLVLLETGEIAGRVAQQPDVYKILTIGDTIEFNFTIRAFSRTYPLLTKSKQFKITVYQYYPEPLENVYFKAFPNTYGKRVILSLLTDTSLIPTDYLYRPNDMYFGKATDVRFVHVYGITASSMQSYINATQKNYYERKITLGEIKTAIATDSDGTVLYEVVYSNIIDNLQNENGKGVSDKLTFNNPISLRLGPWFINNSSLLINTSTVKINASPGTTRFVYPAGLHNMRSALTSNITQNFDNRLMPSWMTSQQTDTTLDSTLGYVQGWIICYTKPGYAEIIKNNINENWNYTLNEIDFTIDRFIVDKSATYNWNTNLTIPSWSDLPSATPVPDPFDSNDAVVLFSKKTILPNS